MTKKDENEDKKTTEKVTRKRKAPSTAVTIGAQDGGIFQTLTLLDSVIQFLTKATGQAMVPLKTLLTTVPSAKVPFDDLLTLLQNGILQIKPGVTTSAKSVPDNNIAKHRANLKIQWDLGKNGNSDFTIGFPDTEDQRLSRSTKTAAKLRLSLLRKRLKSPQMQLELPSEQEADALEEDIDDDENDSPATIPRKEWVLQPGEDPEFAADVLMEHEQDARSALHEMLGLVNAKKKQDCMTLLPTFLLPKQVSYAGTFPAQSTQYDKVGKWKANLDPRIVAAVTRQLYTHQSSAIESALDSIPTLVCTGTGSGKSLCFILPVLNAALKGERSLLLFPTKALAQDQIVKLQAWLQEHNLHQDIHAATLDGDTPHSQRVDICTSCNVILTNPDTLHAGILPNWKHLYKPLLSNVRYVVLDEAHMYTGVFGAHVSMILARLYRLTCLEGTNLCFLACSATLAHPEAHFRLLCCIPKDRKVHIVKEDTSPRAAKHYFVWNPPILDMNGKSIGRVYRKRKNIPLPAGAALSPELGDANKSSPLSSSLPTNSSTLALEKKENPPQDVQHRRHSADETALLLALAVSRGVRCIAFCKTRSLVEWVYERTLTALKQSPATSHLISKVESYRGGYTKSNRRQIEEKLFHNQLLGVVGTSALELGVDIGGVDLTLHCGFPSSRESLIQQSGRAGRGANASTSLAICVCFNAPMDQHIWRYPSSLLSRGVSAPISMPIYPGLVQGHLLCAGQEFPLTGNLNASIIQSNLPPPSDALSDKDLFGSPDVYKEALETLLSQGAMVEEKLAVASRKGRLVVHKTHPSIKNPWTQVSIRSIEPVSYQIVDTSHPKQAGRTDGIHDEDAVLDTIPYSRIFYHAHPGAIITHRTRRYRITSMTRPPAFGSGFRGSITLGAFAKPCEFRYLTRPLSTLKITVVKQFERVNATSTGKESSLMEEKRDRNNTTTPPSVTELYSDTYGDPSVGSLAGCGVVTVKRNVHGYKKISIVTREEISRSELSLPDMEFDTFALWLDCGADLLVPHLGETKFGFGVHALSHALVAVAPLFVPCTVSDLDCDHSFHGTTRVTLFDARAGGSGICSQLWKFICIPNGILEAALDLLGECPSCSHDESYDGGCPACLQASECTKFNDFLSKSAGLAIGKFLLDRLKKTDPYMVNSEKMKDTKESEIGDKTSRVCRQSGDIDVGSPRRERRERAMRNACDIVSARERQVVVGRPSWPMDRSDGPRHEQPGE